MNEEYRNIFIIVVVVIFGIFMYHAQKYSYITDQGLVIAFFGILATFVVIGNYAQTKDAKDKVEQMQTNVNRIIKDLYDDNARPIFQGMKNMNEDSIKNIIAEYMSENNKSYNEVINLLFGEIVSQEQADIIKALANNQEYKCKVINPATRREVGVDVQLNAENHVIFRKNNNVINNVEIGNGQRYDEDEWRKKIHLWKEIDTLIPKGTDALNQAFPQQHIE